MDVPVFEQFTAIAARFPDKVAIDDGEQRLTYAELEVQATRVSRKIDAAIPSEQAVGLLIHGRIPLSISMLACFRSGRPYIALNPSDPALRIQDLLKVAGVTALVADRPTAVSGGPLLLVSDLVEDDGAATAEIEPPQTHVDAPAVINFTSGSTGRPKGVVNSQRCFLHRIRELQEVAQLTSEDVYLPLWSPIAIPGARDFLAAVLTGSTAHLLNVAGTGIGQIRRRINETGATILGAVPSLLREVLSGVGPGAFPSVRTIKSGGEGIRCSDVALAYEVFPAGGVLLIGYASTESCGSQWYPTRDFPARGLIAPIGYTGPGIEFAVVDDNGAAVPTGEVGELVVRSPYLALGEWRGGQLVPGALTTDPEDATKRIFSTGDMVSVDPDGLLHYAGRKDRQIKVNGNRVDLTELEMKLHELPTLSDAAALNSTTGELIVFVVAPRRNPEEVERELRETIKATLPQALRPARIHVVDELPRLPSRKIDALTMRNMDVEAQARAEIAVSRQGSRSVSEAVNAAWRTFLRGAPADRSWEDAGGDSLGLIGFIFQIESEIGIELPLESFALAMTRAQIVDAIHALQNASPAAGASATAPTAFFLPGGHGDVPASAGFRTELYDRLRMIPLRYTGLKDLVAAQPAVRDIAKAAALDIAARQPSGPISIIGYSFGGAVAYETAAALLAMGREVKRVGILDSYIGQAPQASKAAKRFAEGPAKGLLFVQRAVARRLTHLLMARGWGKLTPVLLAWAPIAPKTRALLTVEIEGALRVEAMQRWLKLKKPTLPLSAVVFRAEDGGEDKEADLGWGGLFSSLKVVSFAGDHVSCLMPPHSQGNAENFVAALGLANGDARTASLLAKSS